MANGELGIQRLARAQPARGRTELRTATIGTLSDWPYRYSRGECGSDRHRKVEIEAIVRGKA